MPKLLGEDIKINCVFYYGDPNTSPYQGLLQYTQAEWDALSDADYAAAQLAQYAAWKANYDQLQADAAAQAAAQDQPVT